MEVVHETVHDKRGTDDGCAHSEPHNIDIGSADIIIGTHMEKVRYGIPVYELGFPSFDRHVMNGLPYLGFSGALNICQGLYDMLSAKNDRFLGVRNETLRLGLDPDIFLK
jgi:nitrogenase molybdenum-iron protein alpha/beta subunit